MSTKIFFSLCSRNTRLVATLIQKVWAKVIALLPPPGKVGQWASPLLSQWCGESKLNAFWGEPASSGSGGISPLTTTYPLILQHQLVGPPLSFTQASSCSWIDHPVRLVFSCLPMDSTAVRKVAPECPPGLQSRRTGSSKGPVKGIDPTLEYGTPNQSLEAHPFHHKGSTCPKMT
ncbi:hypothetical protein H5410_051175 [Solanum commersonii]|uniref:Uncharacterized protein n=1 Tax=Solanum commersonii TaxID=4109 RepID=A0A9J5WZR7_SOLCO|nr:hypothetical protein H5410_051175 [Solanum commersonii]